MLLLRQQQQWPLRADGDRVWLSIDKEQLVRSANIIHIYRHYSVRAYTIAI